MTYGAPADCGDATRTPQDLGCEPGGGNFNRLSKVNRMRPQQQNRRMRGRGNNNNNNNNSGNSNNNQNRRGPNPLTRSYESNGPDVKIRGTAQQVAEKYTTLSRDAHSSGDRVMAENYLQHAEHYNRIIATALAQQALQQQQQPREFQDEFEGEEGDDDNIELPRQIEAPQQSSSQPQPQQQHVQPQPAYQPQGLGPQPVIEGIPAEVAHAEGGVNGEANGEAGGAAGETAPRRGRRRRPMRSRSESGGAEDGEPATQTEGEPV
jgi:hypothetical protein